MHQLTKQLSLYQEITVCEANQLYGEMGKFRFMQFSDHAVQGAIDLKDPKRIVLEYPRAIIHLMEYNHPSFESLFMIGHGIGTIPSYWADKQVTVVELDEKVLQISRDYFNYNQTNVVIGDGRSILGKQAPHSYDYIVLDAFTKEGTPHHLTTLQFFNLTKEKLQSSGALIMNLMGKAKKDKYMEAMHTTLCETYAFTKAFLLPGGGENEMRNIIVIGSDHKIDYLPHSMAGFVEIEFDQGHIIRDKI
ncbi:fused MFS/spermidine synthase [Paenibacillus sp. ACRRX]|uniref:spermidine synthase n=1 Tax=unclassified Paenibacillus TaxID=185978 RepID=UPI001EF662C5|nr:MULTISPECIES: fused MFS/spermidine synthase [unclassified Paenibacillus]MCG7409214.1 fused MFS/spermidine synthase [Paenibacillus sp. ACRRX]MDK8181794.1 fused MFS/spermidine synthase [Paenibacillus sp. UMB4589-SE434]